MFDKKVFGERLRKLRLDKKINQQTIAELLGVTRTQVSDIENGKTTTSLERVYLLADYFHVSIDYLLGRENYWQDSDGNIKVKVPADIFNLDTNELKKKLGQE